MAPLPPCASLQQRPRLRPSMVPSSLRSPFMDQSHVRYYAAAAPRTVCGSSNKGGKAARAAAKAAARGQQSGLQPLPRSAAVRGMVAEVDVLLGRMERESPLPQPLLAVQLTRTSSSSSTITTTSSSSSSSSSSESSDSEAERAQRAARRRAAQQQQQQPAARDAAAFELQRDLLLQRLASGSFATTSSQGGVAAAAPPAATAAAPRAPAAAQVQVCTGKACQRAGAATVLAEFQAAAADPRRPVIVDVVGCSKCMGRCKAAPNVRVTTADGRSVMHSGVSTAQRVRAVLHGAGSAHADLFDFV